MVFFRDVIVKTRAQLVLEVFGYVQLPPFRTNDQSEL